MCEGPLLSRSTVPPVSSARSRSFRYIRYIRSGRLTRSSRVAQVPTREELLHHMPTLAELEEETLLELKETGREVAELTGLISMGEKSNDRKSQVSSAGGMHSAQTPAIITAIISLS